MKTIQRRLDNIEGFDLTNNEKTKLTGGVAPCNFRCQLYDENGQPIGPQDCCPYETREQCETEIFEYYFDFGYAVWCWSVN